MRSENEMFNLILNVARQDSKIRAVYMNGSRANPNAPKDIFQDYDIVYIVTETKPFVEDKLWIDCFGKRLMLQMPDNMDYLRGLTCNFNDTYGWLIQFTDGNRLDLHVQSIPYGLDRITEDKLCVVLLDKDLVLPQLHETTDEDYHVRRPTQNDYLCDCNNFWWCLNNVAKGLWREEVPYVMDMINEHIRPHLVNMLTWKIGVESDFSCSVGKSGKYMNHFLNEEIWERFIKTYSDGQIDHIWEATFEMCKLFDEVSVEVADKLGFFYNKIEADSSRAFLEHVHKLPKDATEIY